MGLKDLFKGGMDDPVRGTAQIVSASMHHGRGIYQSCRMNVVIQAEGVPATAIQLDVLAHQEKWPFPGMVLPVTVDRADPAKVEIEWDEVRSAKDRAKQNAENLAAMMRGQPPAADAGMQTAGAPMVMNLSGADLSQLSEEQKARLRMLGIDPDGLSTQQGAATGGAVPVPPPPPAGDDEVVDERLERLERLAKLKEQGVLTDGEFQAQKAQILED